MQITASPGCALRGREHLWSRRLVMNYHEAQAVLPKTFATVAFVDIDGRSQ
jgi:hypothetical protein